MPRKSTFTTELVPAAVELSRFIKGNRVGVTRAARELGVKHPSLIAWLRGASRPGDHHRKAIEVWTHGKVLEEHWLTDTERDALAGVEPFNRAEGAA